MALVTNHRRNLRALALPMGMIVGGALQNAGRKLLPPGAVKEFFTSGVTWQSGPQHTWGLLIGSISFGPAALDISLLAICGAAATIWLAIVMFD